MSQNDDRDRLLATLQAILDDPDAADRDKISAANQIARIQGLTLDSRSELSSNLSQLSADELESEVRRVLAVLGGSAEEPKRKRRKSLEDNA